MLKMQHFQVVHCGLRAFERTDAYPLDTKSRDRVAQDGAMSLVPYLGRQLVRVTVRLLLRFFKESNIRIDTIEDSTGDRKRIEQIESGGCAIVLMDDDKMVSMEPVVVAAWKSKTTIAILCTRQEREGITYAIAQAYPSLFQEKEPQKRAQAAAKKVEAKGP